MTNFDGKLKIVRYIERLRKIFKIHSFGFKGTISVGNYIAITQKTNKKKNADLTY